MIKKIILICFFIFTSCGIKNTLLLDGITKVPIDEKSYLNKIKYDSTMQKYFDVNCIYEEYDQGHSMPSRLCQEYEYPLYSAFKFYSNGCLNLFFLEKRKELLDINLDPNYAGYRGVYYEEEGVFRIEFFGVVDELKSLGKIKGTLTVKGDTLISYTDNLKYPKYYIKRKLPDTFKKYNAKWDNKL